MTRNQKRKVAYAARASEEQRSSGRQGKHAQAKARRAVRLVGTRVHRRPCGNHACRPCRLIAGG